MLRRSFLRFFTLAESRGMFLDAVGMPLTRPTATLAQTLQVLAEHHHAGDMSLTYAALEWLLSLDSTDADSAMIASYNLCNGGSKSSGRSSGGGRNRITVGGVEYSSSSHLLLQIMSSHANDAAVRERCCRCIANMCQLAPRSTGSPSECGAANEAEDASSNRENDKNIADALVEQGAVELALGTLAMSSSRLSAKGRAWSALAVLNLVCLSHDGVRRAALAKGESVLSDIVVAITHERPRNSEQRLALDAALGSLARLLTSEADDNAAGIIYRNDEAAYGTAEAVGRALVWLSQSALREIRRTGGETGDDDDDNDEGDFVLDAATRVCSTRSNRCGGTSLFFPIASSVQQLAVVTFLPLLHKAWMALKSLSSCCRNLPMVYDALYGPANGRGLQAVIDALMLFCVELEGLSALGAAEEARLQQDVLQYAMGVFADLTATRKDVDTHAFSGTAEASADDSKTNADGDVSNRSSFYYSDDGSNGGVVSAVIPTEAALGVMDTLAAGVVTTIAVSTVVRLHTTRKEEEATERGRGSGVGCVYDVAVFDLLSRCVLVLANMAGYDIAIASTNTLAALHALLQDAADLLSEIEARQRAAPALLFSGAAQQDQLVLAQQCALAGQIYAAVWGVLRTPDGARTVAELRIHDTVKRLQVVLESMRDGAFPGCESAARDDGSNADNTCALLHEKQSSASASASMANLTPTAAAAWETLQGLLPLGRRVMQCLEMVITTGSTRAEGQQKSMHAKVG